jgi:hypothetical protein
MRAQMAMIPMLSGRGISLKEPGRRTMDTSDTPAYYIGYHVQETEAGKIWSRVATAWPSPNDQGGFTVTLLAVPLSGTIVFLPSTGTEKTSAT